MNGFLLDTNVLSELRKRQRCHAGVAAWFDSLNDEEIFTSVLVTGEIRRGIELVWLKDKRKARVLENWLQGLVNKFSARILSIDSETADCWGRLCLKQKLPDVDGLLAATALVHDLTLATRNTADFARSGVRLCNPFDVS